MNRRTRLFADGADLATIARLAQNPTIQGFTTNPSLMRKSGVSQYKDFAKQVLEVTGDRPVSFEVLADEFNEMCRQGREIASWGPNAYVKVPITNTKGESTKDVVQCLGRNGAHVNVTGMFTLDQVRDVLPALSDAPASNISIFAGRIADTGVDPLPIMREALDMIQPYPQIELIWASPREVLNVCQAEQIGCHIITLTKDILEKLSLIGKDLTQYSLETVKMFYEDGQRAGLSI